jgi:putative Ca2+/H+ antiporter (TMEM165/GDT1 family)
LKIELFWCALHLYLYLAPDVSKKCTKYFKSTHGRIKDMEAFLISTGIVALAEMGDKTQLLSLVLAARFRKPWPIVWGILVATLANHALAGGLGAWVTSLMGPTVLRWVLGVSFLAMAAWMLVPDKLDDDDADVTPKFGVFGTTVIAFFLAEMGDKTQIATVMLAAEYQSWVWVVAGTTLGMMLANAPVVWFGERITRLVPLTWVHRISAAVFVVLGLLVLFGSEAPETHRKPHESIAEAVIPSESASVASPVTASTASTTP